MSTQCTNVNWPGLVWTVTQFVPWSRGWIIMLTKLNWLCNMRQSPRIVYTGTIENSIVITSYLNVKQNHMCDQKHVTNWRRLKWSNKQPSGYWTRSSQIILYPISQKYFVSSAQPMQRRLARHYKSWKIENIQANMNCEPHLQQLSTSLLEVQLKIVSL